MLLPDVQSSFGVLPPGTASVNVAPVFKMLWGPWGELGTASCSWDRRDGFICTVQNVLWEKTAVKEVKNTFRVFVY